MLLSILIFGLLVRLINLNQSLWLDEGTTALVTRDLSWSEFLNQFLINDFHPPLYYVLIKALSGITSNYSEVFLRIVSVLSGVGTIFITFKIGQKWSRNVGLVSALLLATAPLHIYYSQEARMYSLAALFVALSVYFYVNKDFKLYALASALAFWTDYLTIFVLPVFLLHSLFIDKKQIKNVLVHTAVSAILCLPMLSFLPNQLSRGLAQEGSSWWGILGQTNLKNIFLVPVKFVVGRISFPKPFYQLIFIFIGSVIGMVYFYATKLSKNVILWLWLITPIVVGAFVGLFIPVLSYFRFLFVLPAVYLLIAVGLNSIPKSFKTTSFVIILVANVVFAGIYLFDQTNHREDWRKFSARVRASSIAKSVVVFPSNSQREAYNYYTGLSNVYEVTEIDSDVNEIWLVRYVYDIVDPADRTRAQIESLGFGKAGEFDFNGVVIWRYTRK